MADDLPTPAEIIATHERVEEIYDLKHKGIMKSAPTLKLRRSVLNPASEYEDPFHRAAVLLFETQSVHVFEDANKRTAWTVMIDYLDRVGIELELGQDDETVELIIRRAGLYTIDELATWIRTGEIDESRLPEN